MLRWKEHQNRFHTAKTHCGSSPTGFSLAIGELLQATCAIESFMPTVSHSRKMTGVYGGTVMGDYIAFANIESVRSSQSDTGNELFIGPPSFLETFPNLQSFGSSLLLKEHFGRIDKFLGEMPGWRKWLLLLKVQDGSDRESIDAMLIRAPYKVKVCTEQLKTATAAFEKQLMVAVKVQIDNDKVKLKDIELLRE